jgi:3-hydroxyisobutyrate dehydrogenase
VINRAQLQLARQLERKPVPVMLQAAGVDQRSAIRLQRQGVDPKQILDAVASTPVWSAVAGRIAASMLSGTFDPQFPIELIEKDFSYTVHTAGGEENAPAITAIRNIFRKAISEGLGELNMTAVVKLFEGHKD